MLIFLLFAATIIASSVVCVFYKNYTTLESRKSDILLLFIGMSLPSAIVFAVMCAIRGFEFSLPTALTALGAAVCHFTAVYMLIKSMSSGSYSVSVIIINMNFCVPIICSALFLREKVSLLQLFGVLLLVFMIVIINMDFSKFRKRPTGEEPQELAVTEEKPKQKAGYLVFALLACLGNGLMNFLIKTQQHFTPGAGQNTFYFILYAAEAVFSLIAFLVVLLVKGKIPKEEGKQKLKISLTGLFMGICFVACMYPQTRLAELVSASVLYTVVTAGAVLLSIALGCIRFKEKFTWKNAVSTVCCIAAIALQLIS